MTTTSTHANLTGSDLHELKGAAAATSGLVPVANGSGGTVFQMLDSSSLAANSVGSSEIASGAVTASKLDSSTVFAANQFTVCGYFPDLSTPGSIYLAVPHAGTLIAVYLCIANAISTSPNAVTVLNTAGSTAATISATSSGSAAGVIYSATGISTNNTFAVGTKLTITSDGGGGNTVPTQFVCVFTQTGA